MRAELTDLDRRFVIARVDAIVSGAAVAIEKPRNADDLISEAEYARDERLPYWADLWPAAVVLSEHIATMPATVGARALELGCGLGIPGLTALACGLRVTFSDYDLTAMKFAGKFNRDP